MSLLKMMSLKWDDIVSSPMDISEYLKKNEKNDQVKKIYKKYKPKTKIINKIITFLLEKELKLKILVLGAKWCPDCNKYSPQLIRIVEKIGRIYLDLKFIYGVKVDPFHKENDIIWHKTKSPPEAINPKFKLEKIPTIYFFDAAGLLIGKIIESPRRYSKLEKEFLYVLEKKYKH